MKKIPLTQGKFALVDDEDFEELSRYKWYADKNKHTFYVKRDIRVNLKKQKVCIMHRAILKATKGSQVDHRDGNGLNNQRENLRLCTSRQNSQNQRCCRGGTSKYKGVCRCGREKKWRVSIGVNGKKWLIGYFTDEIEAARTYDKKAKEVFGEFACTNF